MFEILKYGFEVRYFDERILEYIEGLWATTDVWSMQSAESLIRKKTFHYLCRICTLLC